MSDVLGGGIVDPVELTAFIRDIVDATISGPNSLERFLPRVDRLALEWSFNYAERERPKVAHYRAFDTEADLTTRPGFNKVSGAIPPIARKMLLSEQERTRLNLAYASNDVKSTYLRELVFNDAERITKEVLARVELARGSVLQTGTVTFTSEEALELTINYNDGASSIQTNAASPLWTVANAATSTPIADMIDWMEDYADNNYDDQPVVGVTSRKVIAGARASDEVKGMLQGSMTNPPSIVTEGQFNQLLAAYGIPPLVEYRTRLDVDGTVTRVLDENKIIWLPAASVESFGETMYGVTADALDMAEQGGIPLETAPGLVGRSWKSIDPPQNWVRVAGLVLPVLKDPKRIMVSTATE